MSENLLISLLGLRSVVKNGQPRLAEKKRRLNLPSDAKQLRSNLQKIKPRQSRTRKPLKPRNQSMPKSRSSGKRRRSSESNLNVLSRRCKRR